MSSERPAAAAVVLPSPDNSPMSHAAGHCIGPGSRTGPYCVPIEQRPPVPAGRSFGQVPGSPSAPGLLSPSVPVGPGREGSPGAGRALLTPKNPAVARGHPQSWLQPLHPPTRGLAGAAATQRGSEQGTEDPRSLQEQQTSPPTTFPLLSLARIGQAAGGERQLGTASPWQEPAWPEGHSPQPDPGSRSSPLPPLRCTDKARPRAPRGGRAGTVPVGPGLQRGQKKQDRGQGWQQDRGRGWQRHKQTPSLHQTSCRTHPHHHPPSRDSGHCCHYNFLLFSAFLHTRYKTLLFHPPAAARPTPRLQPPARGLSPAWGGPGYPSCGDRHRWPQHNWECGGWLATKMLGWIHPPDRWGANPHGSTRLEALGLPKVPKNPGAGAACGPGALRTVQSSELQSQVLPRRKFPLR